MKNLNPAQLRYLRAQAHHLNPVVMVGNAGLSASVLKEIGAALKAHELIKIKVMNDERVAREEMFKTICETLKVAPVQHIGKTLVVFQPAAPSKFTLPK